MIGLSSCHNGCWILWISPLGDRTVTLELLPEKCQHGVYPHLLIKYLGYNPALQTTHSSCQREKITRVCVWHTHPPPLSLSSLACKHMCAHTHRAHMCDTVFWWPLPQSQQSQQVLGLSHFPKSEPKTSSLAWKKVGFSGQGPRSTSPRQVQRKWQSSAASGSGILSRSRLGRAPCYVSMGILQDTHLEGGPRLDRRGACLGSTPNGRFKLQDTPRTPWSYCNCLAD